MLSYKLVSFYDRNMVKTASKSIDVQILRSIRATGSASAFSTKHFLQFGTRPAVNKALNRLADKGVVRRIRRGLYDLPRSHPVIGKTAPDAMGVVRALMEGSNAVWQVSGAYAANLLGLSEQVPAQIDILTNGISRKVVLGKLTIRFRHASPRNLVGAGTTAGTIIQAVRYLKRDGLSDQMIAKLCRQADASTKKALLKLAPKVALWMQPILKQIAS